MNKITAYFIYLPVIPKLKPQDLLNYIITLYNTFETCCSLSSFDQGNLKPLTSIPK